MSLIQKTFAIGLSLFALCASYGSATAVTRGNMKAYCRGEVSGQYATKPAYVKTGNIVKTKSGSQIAGTVDLGDQGVKKFLCRFDKKGNFIDVMAMTSDGE